MEDYFGTRSYHDIPSHSKLVFLLHGDEEDLHLMEPELRWFWFVWQEGQPKRKKAPNLIKLLKSQRHSGRKMEKAFEDLLFKIYWNYRRHHKQRVPLCVAHHDIWNSPSGYILLQYVAQKKLASYCQSLLAHGLGNAAKLEEVKATALECQEYYLNLSQARRDHLGAAEKLPSVTSWCFQEPRLAETDYDDQLDKLIAKGSVESVATLLAKEDSQISSQERREVPDARFYRSFSADYQREFILISILLLLNIFCTLFLRPREK